MDDVHVIGLDIFFAIALIKMLAYAAIITLYLLRAVDVVAVVQAEDQAPTPCKMFFSSSLPFLVIIMLNYIIIRVYCAT